MFRPHPAPAHRYSLPIKIASFWRCRIAAHNERRCAYTTRPDETSAKLRLRLSCAGCRRYGLSVQLLEPSIDFLEQRRVAWVPVLNVARLARLIEVVRGLPQLVGLLRLDDLHHFQPDVS